MLGVTQVERGRAGNTLAALLVAKKSAGILYCPKRIVIVRSSQ